MCRKSYQKDTRRPLTRHSLISITTERRGHVEDNPWTGQRLSERRNGGPEKEREFTDAEVTRLLTAPYPEGMQFRERLHDAMRIAALSGMRIEELARLTVADCAGGLFDIRKAKTAAGIRKVPIYADLAPIVERRTAGKRAAAFLIEEIEKVKGNGQCPLSKQFVRYRRPSGWTTAPKE